MNFHHSSVIRKYVASLSAADDSKHRRYLRPVSQPKFQHCSTCVYSVMAGVVSAISSLKGNTDLYYCDEKENYEVEDAHEDDDENEGF